MSWQEPGRRTCNEQGVVNRKRGESAAREQRKQRSGSEEEWQRSAHAEIESVRWEKVLTLQAAIREGTYRISAEDVANRILCVGRRNDRAVLGMYSA